ncbi:MAG: methyltransferase family protein, partial [Plesiomonas shigelloides]
MYTGLALWLVAWALYLDSVIALAGVAVFVSYMTRFQIKPEERAMQALFGVQFELYKARVRRWL